MQVGGVRRGVRYKIIIILLLMTEPLLILQIRGKSEVIRRGRLLVLFWDFGLGRLRCLNCFLLPLVFLFGCVDDIVLYVYIYLSLKTHKRQRRRLKPNNNNNG